jgi:hypothetical protein
MNNFQTAAQAQPQRIPETSSGSGLTIVRPAASAPGAADDLYARTPNSGAFVNLLSAFRASGGTARGDDLGRLLEDHRCGDFVSLARLIVSDDIFGFEWRHSYWVPMFQFDLSDLSTRIGPQQVRAVLALDEGWRTAVWFARPNRWLMGQRPVDLIESELSAVIHAARQFATDDGSSGEMRSPG